MEDRDGPTRELPQPGELWRHWRGGLYRVVCLALNEGTHGECVVYADAAREGHCWVRPLWQWLQEITVPGGDRHQRFAKLTEAEIQELAGEDSSPAGPTDEQRGSQY